MIIKDADISRVANVLGYPDPVALPQDMGQGPIGWSYEQAQGTTANLSGILINIPNVQTGDYGDTPEVPGRIGGVLDNLSQADTPQVTLRAKRVMVELSATSDSDVFSGDFLSELKRKLILRWKPSNAEYVFPLCLAIRTSPTRVMRYDVGTDEDHTSTAEDGVWQSLGVGGIDVNLNTDSFDMRVLDDVALPTSATVRFDLWFDGIVIKNSNIDTDQKTVGCGTGSVAVRQAERVGAELARVRSLPTALNR